MLKSVENKKLSFLGGESDLSPRYANGSWWIPEKNPAATNKQKKTTESWIEVFSKKIMIQNTLDLLLKKTVC